MVLPNYKQWAESLYFVVTTAGKDVAVAELAYALRDAENLGKNLQVKVNQQEYLRVMRHKEVL